MRLTKYFAPAVFALFLLAPAPSYAYGEGPHALALTWEDNGKIIDGHVGQTLVLTLEENPTTGFGWVMHESNPGVLSLMVSKFEQETALQNHGFFGVGGKRIYVFKISSSGVTQLDLIYKRPWEPMGIENFSVIIDVAP